MTSARVYVVDDDASVAKALQRVLRSAGIDAVVCASARACLEAYDPSVPGCVVVDLAMPGMGGLDLQSFLRCRRDAPPVVFISGHAALTDNAHAAAGDAVVFLPKPVEAHVLIDAVNDAVARDRAARNPA